MKTTVQDVQQALANEDTAEVQKLVDDLYEQILKYEADIETNKTRYDVLKSKFDDISKQLEEANFKVEEVSVTKFSTDPQMKVLNRMFDDAVT
jgi:phage shock protein A